MLFSAFWIAHSVSHCVPELLFTFHYVMRMTVPSQRWSAGLRATCIPYLCPWLATEGSATRVPQAGAVYIEKAATWERDEPERTPPSPVCRVATDI